MAAPTYGAGDWIKFAGLCLFVVWSAKQAFGYFTFSYEELMEDFGNAPLPLNAAGKVIFLRHDKDLCRYWQH